jgi:hypothetical protein
MPALIFLILYLEIAYAAKIANVIVISEDVTAINALLARFLMRLAVLRTYS